MLASATSTVAIACPPPISATPAAVASSSVRHSDCGAVRSGIVLPWYAVYMSVHSARAVSRNAAYSAGSNRTSTVLVSRWRHEMPVRIQVPRLPSMAGCSVTVAPCE